MQSNVTALEKITWNYSNHQSIKEAIIRVTYKCMRKKVAKAIELK